MPWRTTALEDLDDDHATAQDDQRGHEPAGARRAQAQAGSGIPERIPLVSAIVQGFRGAPRPMWEKEPNAVIMLDQRARSRLNRSKFLF
jgi:hypothetical protein